MLQKSSFWISLTLVTFIVALVILEAGVEAQQRGLVTSAPCPYSCRSRGLRKKVCRDWKQGQLCYVEDLTKPPGGNTNPAAQGRVTSKPCPHSCASMGIPKNKCRDWRQGHLCFVEDQRGGGATAPASGNVTSKACPYSCKMLGLKKKRCRDWRSGNLCFVEKLR